MGRKLKSWEQITNGSSTPTPRTLLSQMNFNELGQPISKQLHSTDSVNFFQTVAYTYNERGWLLTSSAPLFAMTLYYNNTVGTDTEAWNGNITYQFSGTPGAENTHVVYSYDKLNRLTSGISTTNNNESGIAYDMEGNITALTRTQAGATIDNLTYTYNNTNQLQNVVDGNSSNAGLVSGTMSYLYDGNGNLLSGTNTVNTAQNKNFTYNLLNLPQLVTIPTGTVTYTYDAGGNKLRKVDVINGTTTTTDYISGIQYETGSTAIDLYKRRKVRQYPQPVVMIIIITWEIIWATPG